MKNSIYCISIILHHTLTLNRYKACPISYPHYLTLRKMGKSVPLRRNIFLIQVSYYVYACTVLAVTSRGINTWASGSENLDDWWLIRRTTYIHDIHWRSTYYLDPQLASLPSRFASPVSSIYSECGVLLHVIESSIIVKGVSTWHSISDPVGPSVSWIGESGVHYYRDLACRWR